MYPVVGFGGASLAMYPVVGLDGASLAMHPVVGLDAASSAMSLWRSAWRTRVMGGPPLPPVLSLYLFGTKEGPSGTPLATHPPVGFASLA